MNLSRRSFLAGLATLLMAPKALLAKVAPLAVSSLQVKIEPAEERVITFPHDVVVWFDIMELWNAAGEFARYFVPAGVPLVEQRNAKGRWVLLRGMLIYAKAGVEPITYGWARMPANDAAPFSMPMTWAELPISP